MLGEEGMGIAFSEHFEEMRTELRAVWWFVIGGGVRYLATLVWLKDVRHLAVMMSDCKSAQA